MNLLHFIHNINFYYEHLENTNFLSIFFLAHILKVETTRAQDLCKTSRARFPSGCEAEEIFFNKFLEMLLNYVVD